MTAYSNKHSYNRANYVSSSVAIFTLISSLILLITFILLLTTNQQFIAFNEFSATGKYPAIFFYVSLLFTIVYTALFVASIFGLWATADIINKWGSQVRCLLRLFIVCLICFGLVQLAAGILTLVYTKTMPIPLREYMADNLRSNYTGGYGIGYLERQFDRSVDWVQINYQCCGVKSYEDYRNGFYYNSFNKYTIVSIVPNSCCIYREGDQNQPTKCQMKSINVYRKGCYDILMWWMDSFGSIISSIGIVFGILNGISAGYFIMIYSQVRRLKIELKKKHLRLKNNAYNRMPALKPAAFDDDTNTTMDNISCAESKT